MPTGQARPVGRPTKVTPELLAKAATYLNDGVWNADGDVLPTVEGLACYLDVSRDTLYANDQFSDTLEQVSKTQARNLINRSLMGDYNPTIAKMMLSAKHGYVEKTAQDLTTDGEKINTIVYKPEKRADNYDA